MFFLLYSFAIPSLIHRREGVLVSLSHIILALDFEREWRRKIFRFIQRICFMSSYGKINKQRDIEKEIAGEQGERVSE